MLEAQAADLDALGAIGRRRALAPRAGVDFASNDYLALAGSERLADAAREAIGRGVPVGSGGSRLLRGNHDEIEALEAEAAAFFGHEAALWLSSGFAANVALLSTLPQRGDLIVNDTLIHASAHDGMRLSRAEAVAAAHNDAQAFDDAVVAWRRGGGTGTPWIAVESLYSMDGDRAPLDDLATIAERHDAMLVVDEAHATGVFGKDGRGLAHALAPERTIALHTCGKAMGAEGALITGPAVMRDFIVNRGRGFIFSTAPSPLIAAVVRESLRTLVDQPERRAALWRRIAHARTALGLDTGSQILPLVLGEDQRTMGVAAELQAAGFDVRGIRPPTVPPGTARLRISITNHASLADIDALGALIKDLL
ncbi:8-amino-7-oxononanoate synthase [Sphingomonas spermidinifaciens]|uniref:8-amino-7-oxononanoate synthase n=1 Tax=Sphingomonas spermidinifaciens TaxID=1141889 RepID=A0A2A4B555_9SPHN|nr:8-amino-7-oxononanoate synthase [Sphingomonas spermidinifaciens]PCD03571.1 8-amino-7-oxononanoate synthase [Sphingomonas spermidinifaciens]